MPIIPLPAETVSCLPQTLHWPAAHNDGDDLAAVQAAYAKGRRSFVVVAEIFPVATVARPHSADILASDPDFKRVVDLHFQEIDEQFRRVPPSLLVRLDRALIWNNVVFAVVDGAPQVLYEFYRPVDRPVAGPAIIERLKAAGEPVPLSNADGPVLFSGSAGSFNYGHWLIDELPLLTALEKLDGGGLPAKVIMTSFGSAMNEIRCQGLALIQNGLSGAAPLLIDATIPYAVENLHFVTPATYHPYAKNPAIVGVLRDLGQRALKLGDHRLPENAIYVTRGEGLTRRLLTESDIAPICETAGFRLVVPDQLPLVEQWATFAGADQVIGVMGAAMANTVFCRSGARLLYLAPQDWIEPFYWDLAAICGHHYAVYHGVSDEAHEARYQRNFSIRADDLRRAWNAQPDLGGDRVIL